MVSTALCLTACGGTITNEGQGIVPGSALRRDGRSCGLAAVPDTLPSVNRLVDSAAVGHLAEVSAVSADLVYGLRFSPQGQLAGITLLEPADPTPLAHPYRDLISRTIRTQPPQESVWGMRLRIRTGEQSNLRVARAEYCPPSPVRTPPMRRPPDIMTADDLEELRRARPCRVLVRVTELGVAVGVRLIESSGSDIWDRDVLDSWHRRRFDPATLDGTPVAAEFTAVARIQVRSD